MFQTWRNRLAQALIVLALVVYAVTLFPLMSQILSGASMYVLIDYLGNWAMAPVQIVAFAAMTEYLWRIAETLKRIAEAKTGDQFVAAPKQ